MTARTTRPALAGAGTAIGASPLAGARYAVSQLVADAEAALGHFAGRLEQARAERDAAAERSSDTAVICQNALAHLGRLQPRDIQEVFAAHTEAAARLAAAEERLLDLDSRHAETLARLEALRGTRASLDELAESDAGMAVDGAARFRSASRQVFQIIEQERMRIARDMHDGPAQALANLVLQAEVLERLVDRDRATVLAELNGFKSGVRSALEETRRLIFDLRPMTLDDLGLVPTLRRFVHEFGERTGLHARFQLVGAERRLASTYEAVVFRIVQEALANVRKHARARSVDVVLTIRPQRVSALVKDDGEGFDVAATEARQGRTRHLGLISMRERADLEKGMFELRSQLGRGTEVRVAFDC